MSGLTLTPITLSPSSQSWESINVSAITSGTPLDLDSNPRSVYLNEQFVSSGVAGNYQLLQIDGTVKGASPAGPTSGIRGIVATTQDATGVGNKTVSGAANNGSGLIRLTVTGHGYSTGDSIAVYGVVGTTEANGQWVVTMVDTNHIDLQGSTFSNAYSSGGTTTNRGSAYGVFGVVGAAVDRGGLTGTALDGDDMNAFGAFNKGPGKATTGYLVNRNTSNSVDYVYGFSVEGNCDFAFRASGSYGQYGLDLSVGTYGLGAIYIPNNVGFYAINAADNGRVELFACNTLNEMQIYSTSRFSGTITFEQNMTINDAVNIALGTTNGTRFGTGTTQKIGFYNAVPISQFNLTGNTHTVTAGSTTNVFTNTTFDGSTGSTAYTVGDIVKALKLLGLLAS